MKLHMYSIIQYLYRYLKHLHLKMSQTQLKKSFNEIGTRLEAGVDEVARGCLAGPVCSAAVIWPITMDEEYQHIEAMIKDSKKLTKKKRETLAEFIKGFAIDWSVSQVSNQIIDTINIRNATFKAMHSAIDGLKIVPDFLLIDGNGFNPYFDEDGEIIEHTCVVGGDAHYISVAAASILAKVYHDEIIEEWCQTNPNYNVYDWKSNMCYGTKKHLDAIIDYGISPLHRKTFGICETSKKNPVFTSSIK